jgi:rhamnogalacturonyl hydrolase YesR
LTTASNLAHARRKQLIKSAQHYSWWLGVRSAPARKCLSLSGWRISRIGYRLLGSPSGALAWPVGLSFLLLNAERKLASADMPWIEHCFAGLVDKTGSPLLPFTHIDHGGLAYAALRLYQLDGDNRYLRYATDMGNAMTALPRTGNNLISYTTGRTEVLVDTLAFICPFLARLSQMTNRPDFAQTALKQLDAIWAYASPASGQWIHHGFDSLNMQRLGLAGWGRGVGWLLMAIVDTVLELPNGQERERWIERGQDLLSRLQGCQKPDGHWSWRLNKPEETSDSSVTGLIAYSLARWNQAYIQGHETYQPMLARCRLAIDTATDKSGRIMQCSGEAAGIGRYSHDFGHYLWAQSLAVATDQICTHSILQHKTKLATL